MSQTFVRGGAGEVRLADILPPNLRSASTKATKEAFAATYEEKNPNVVVVRDWEEVTDSTIAQYRALGRDSQAEQALRDRAALEERRARRQTSLKVPPTLGMDPDRAAKELRRVYANIQGLDPNHPEYERLWGNWTREANELERICGAPRTKFTKGVAPQRNDDEIPKELQDKLNKYVKLAPAARREIVSSTKHADMLRAIIALGIEPDKSIQDIIPEQLFRLGAL